MSRTASILAWVLVVGGLAWIFKVGAIIASDGENTSEGIVAVLFFLGVLGMAVGSTALGLRLTRGRPAWMAVLAALACIVLFFVSFSVIDVAAKATLGDLGGDYMEDEHGIWLTGLAWALVGAWLVRTTRQPQVAASAE